MRLLKDSLCKKRDTKVKKRFFLIFFGYCSTSIGAFDPSVVKGPQAEFIEDYLYLKAHDECQTIRIRPKQGVSSENLIIVALFFDHRLGFKDLRVTTSFGKRNYIPIFFDNAGGAGQDIKSHYRIYVRIVSPEMKNKKTEKAKIVPTKLTRDLIDFFWVRTPNCDTRQVETGTIILQQNSPYSPGYPYPFSVATPFPLHDIVF
jgi:hypothetical protein